MGYINCITNLINNHLKTNNNEKLFKVQCW